MLRCDQLVSWMGVWLLTGALAASAADDSSPAAIRAELKLRGVTVSRATAETAGGGLDIDVRRDVVYAVNGDRKMTADVFLPRGDSKGLRPAVLVVHGGGWLKGDKSKFHHLAAALARRGFVAV